MRSAALACIAALAAAACSHAPAAPVPGAGRMQPNGIKHAVRALASAPELAGSAVPGMFEQCFCSAFFELNQGQAICSDDIGAVMRVQRERALLGAETTPIEEVQRSFDAPRTVALSAASSAGSILVTAIVQDDRGRTLGRFQVVVPGDGGGINERARELASQIASLPK